LAVSPAGQASEMTKHNPFLPSPPVDEPEIVDADPEPPAAVPDIIDVEPDPELSDSDRLDRVERGLAFVAQHLGLDQHRTA